MVFRPRQATSGTILCLASAILLALVSFNTPLLKSMYFLEATFATGQYAGRLRLGTLGYCLTVDGTENCVGPTVGYNFNPNTLFNITVFNIPEAISRYLTYALILHIIALGAAVAATILGLFDHISTLSLLCFPTCSAWLTSTCALLAFIFDLVIFYIAKSRIESVSGASASIGISVWLTLAAWLCAGLSGCAFPLGKKWGSKKRESGDPYAGSSSKYGGGNGYDQAMRLHAIQDEQARKKEQDLPRFAEMEREPLTAGNTEDKYLYEEQNMPGGLRRDGSVLNGVGVGYGRRQPRSNEGHNGGGYGYAPAGAAAVGGLAVAGAGAGAGAYRSHTPGSSQGGYGRRPSPSEMSYAGNAGVGAGPGGIDRPQQAQYDYYDTQAQGHVQGQDQYYDQNYNQNGNTYSDPYANNQAYQPQHHNNGYGISPNPTPAPPPIARTISDSSAYQPNPFPSAQTQLYPPATQTNSVSGGYYPNPHDSAPDNRLSTGYGGYEDDGLGAIGMAATQPSGHTGGYSNTQIYGGGGGASQEIYQPRPQHLAVPRQADILRSPVSEVQHDQYYTGQEDNMGGEAPPPSYGAVPGTGGYRPPQEKAGYTGGR